MKKLLFILCALLAMGAPSGAQITCNPNATLVLFTNYDGGVLNINVDVNIPNLKIGICSYEAVTINLSGAYLSNVVAVKYAGYNSQNSTHCGPSIATTTINGAPVTATTSIAVAPPSPLSNSYGYPSIICGYSCSNTTNQGGCNTVDQIEAYFLNQFPGTVVRMHKAQYGCWSGSQTISGGGTCCPTTAPVPLSVSTAASTPPACFGACTGTAAALASGGQPPYSYQWTAGPNSATYPNRCAGTYTVTVTDALNATASQSVTLSQPAQINTSLSQTACKRFSFGGSTYSSSGVYKDTLLSYKGCDSILTLNLTINTANVNVNQTGAVLSAVAAGASYKWVNCDSSYKAVTGATSQTYTATKNGHYAVIVTQNGCTDTSACKTVTGLAVPEILKDNQYLAYPNPSHDFLILQVGASLQNSTYQIRDELGKIVASGKLSGSHNSISLRQLPAGAYYLKLDRLAEIIRLTKQ